MRTLATKQTAINQYNGFGNQLWDLAGTRPSLDLQFADRKDLVDATTGSNLVDFTRAGSGRYVGSDGLIKTATTNLLLQSEDFNTTWVVEQGTVTTNQATAPNGTVTADDFEDTGSASGLYQLATITANTIYTASIYLKRGDTDWYRLYWVNTDFTSGIRVWVNLATGALGTVNTIGTASNQSGSIASVGDGWYRVSIAGIIDSSSTTGRFQINSASSDNTGTRVINANAFLWGAQLEQSSTVGEYIPTTSTINSAPRFDHDPTTGESLGLLVEESRTNLLEYSEDLPDFANTHATTPFDSSVVNPTGLTGSYKILADSGLSIAGVRIRKAKSSGNNIVVSAFVKKSTYRYVYIGFGGTGSSFTALFDIEPGLTSSRLLGQGGNGTFTNIDAGYQNLPNDWIRIWAVGTTAGIEGPTVGMGPNATTFNITNWTTAGTEEIYAWGLQYEDNVSFPTSYIPTEGSTVTRAADVASITGSNFSSWYRQDEGTVFAEAAVPIGVSSSRAILSIDDGSNTDRIQIRHNGTTARINLVVDNSSTQFSAQFTAGSFIPGQYAKLAMAAKANDFAAVDAVGSVDTDTSGTMPTVNQLQIGLAPSNAQPCKAIKRITYWPARLPDATLLNVTT